MYIEFAEGVLEYANGEYYRKNDGQPFEVDRRFADDVLLKSGLFQAVEEHASPEVTEPVISEAEATTGLNNGDDTEPFADTTNLPTMDGIKPDAPKKKGNK